MQPTDLQRIGDVLAIKWEDGQESYIPLATLRRACPCAGCKGEMDILGNVYKSPDRPLAANAFELVRVGQVGGYAIQPVWADRHDSGIYSYEYLIRVAAAA